MGWNVVYLCKDLNMQQFTFSVEDSEPITIGEMIAVNCDGMDNDEMIEFLNSWIPIWVGMEIGEIYGDGANIATIKRIS